MDRYSISFSFVPSIHGEGVFHLSLIMHRWNKQTVISSETILKRPIRGIEEYDNGDALVWAEHAIDEIYKSINQARAERLDTGWISGPGGPVLEASENLSQEM